MYNRYMSRGFDERLHPAENAQAEPAREPTYTDVDYRTAPAHEPAPNALKGLLGGIKLPEMNVDTLILLVLVYFLIAEEGESISDTLLIVGVLLILGF